MVWRMSDVAEEEYGLKRSLSEIEISDGGEVLRDYESKLWMIE